VADRSLHVREGLLTEEAALSATDDPDAMSGPSSPQLDDQQLRFAADIGRLEAERAALIRRTALGQSRYSVVVADDDTFLLQLVSATLTGAEYDIIEAANGDDALRLIREHHPSLALLDVQMPGLNGLEVCRQVKSDPGLAQIGVILLTGSIYAEDRELSRKVGADAYLTKPFSPLQLLETIRWLVAEHQRHEPPFDPRNPTKLG
jgi:two-component system, OmpR family, phosphate regulon response regulator PhoB